MSLVIADVLELAALPVIEIAHVPVAPAPFVAGAPISASDQETLAEPLTDLPVTPIVIVLAVPQVAVVILAEPSKNVPLIVLAVYNYTACSAVPLKKPIKPAFDNTGNADVINEVLIVNLFVPPVVKPS